MKKNTFEFMRKAVIASRSGTPGRLILFSLLSHCDADGVCWPKNKTLIKMMNKTPRSVQRALEELESLGEISITVDEEERRYFEVLAEIENDSVFFPGHVAGPASGGEKINTPADSDVLSKMTGGSSKMPQNLPKTSPSRASIQKEEEKKEEQRGTTTARKSAQEEGTATALKDKSYKANKPAKAKSRSKPASQVNSDPAPSYWSSPVDGLGKTQAQWEALFDLILKFSGKSLTYNSPGLPKKIKNKLLDTRKRMQAANLWPTYFQMYCISLIYPERRNGWEAVDEPRDYSEKKERKFRHYEWRQLPTFLDNIFLIIPECEQEICEGTSDLVTFQQYKLRDDFDNFQYLTREKIFRAEYDKKIDGQKALELYRKVSVSDWDPKHKDVYSK